MKFISIISIFFSFINPLFCSPKVDTRFGELRGFLTESFETNGGEERKAEVFLNIPYALPPIGKLRFKVS